MLLRLVQYWAAGARRELGAQDVIGTSRHVVIFTDLNDGLGQLARAAEDLDRVLEESNQGG